jgi:hypothetical protein
MHPFLQSTGCQGCSEGVFPGMSLMSAACSWRLGQRSLWLWQMLRLTLPFGNISTGFLTWPRIIRHPAALWSKLCRPPPLLQRRCLHQRPLHRSLPPMLFLPRRKLTPLEILSFSVLLPKLAVVIASGWWRPSWMSTPRYSMRTAHRMES